MSEMIAAGEKLMVVVPGPAPGDFQKQPTRERHVYAIQDHGGDVRVLVADDTGKLQWVGPDGYKVRTG